MTNKGRMIERVYSSEITQRAMLVVLYLINRANEEMFCFPGVKTIARDCHMSERTVRRAIDDLVESGFVKKDTRFRDNGGQSSNLYTLQGECDAEASTENGIEECEEVFEMTEWEGVYKTDSGVELFDYAISVTYGSESEEQVKCKTNKNGFQVKWQIPNCPSDSHVMVEWQGVAVNLGIP